MKKEVFMLKLLLPPLLVIFAATSAPTQTGKPDKLYQVKSIYLGETGAFDRDAFKGYLKRELGRVGFTVVDDEAGADAVLTGWMEIMVTDDGPPMEKPYDKLRFKLTTRDKEEIWSVKLSVQQRTFDNWEKNSANRARKLAERIKSDWNKSAKRAGLPLSAQP